MSVYFDCNIPVVNFLDFRDEQKKEVFIAKFRQAMTTVGFIAITNYERVQKA